MLILLLASTYDALGTSRTKNGGYAMLNSSPPAPARSATTYSWVSVTDPRTYAAGRLSRTAARRMSARTIRRRLRARRSTHAPTKTPSRLGAQTRAVSQATWLAEAPRVLTAISGRASSVIRSPNWETVSPAQKRVNRRFRHNDGAFAGADTPGAGGMPEDVDACPDSVLTTPDPLRSRPPAARTAAVPRPGFPRGGPPRRG